MKRIFLFSMILLLALSGSACRYAHGDGPDVATKKSRKKVTNPRKSNWLNQNLKQERIGRSDINTTGINDNFQVFPHREKGRRSERLKGQSPFFWK